MKLRIIALLFISITIFSAACSTTHNHSPKHDNSHDRFDQGIGDESLLG